LLARTPVRSLIIEQNRAVGVKVHGPDGLEEVRADKVVLSAGGIGTAEILLKADFEGAGEGFFIDPMNIVFGVGSAPGPKNEPTFSVVSSDFMESDGYIIGNLGWTALMSGVPLFFRYFGKSKNIMGLFAKISDSSGGRIRADGKVEKPYTDEDQQKFDKGRETCKNILIQAGANPKSLHVIHNIGGHPGGTAAIGRVVDKDLKANQAENLYVCDASVLPRSPGRPPTLTLIGLAKRLASQM
jgi:choline dehydrogenase-like flavoprotein